jgi:hypothetical protein
VGTAIAITFTVPGSPKSHGRHWSKEQNNSTLCYALPYVLFIRLKHGIHILSVRVGNLKKKMSVLSIDIKTHN